VLRTNAFVVQILREHCNIKLLPPKKKGKLLTLASRVKKSQLNQPELLHILANYQLFFAALERYLLIPIT
jgi:hypothetical protein